MDDLISRKYLYDKIAELEADVRKTIVHQPKGSPEYLRCQSRLNELNEFKSEVRDAPTVEAKEVVHGKWEECAWVELDGHGGFINYPKEGMRCSNCYRAFKKELLWTDNFCPHCGADMRTSAE